MSSRVESSVESLTDRVFTDWLYGELCGSDRVAAPDGTCEPFEFGAVWPYPGGVRVPWGEFEDNPKWPYLQLMLQGSWVSPVVVAEYDRESFMVSLRLGRHMSTSRAPSGSVLVRSA